MRVTLVHNTNAGRGDLSHEALVSLLQDAGHKVDDVPQLHASMRSKAEVIIAAGGDGTALSVARRLVNSSIPMVLLPLGTANNFGRALGMTSSVDHLLSVLANPLERSIDLGMVSSKTWGERYFCESAGVGWFCDALHDTLEEEDKAVEKARQKLAEYLEDYQPRRWDLAIDGKDASGEYVLIEMLNAGALGPNLLLGSEANPTDGLLEVVRATASDRSVLLEYLAALRRGETPPPPELDRKRASHVRIGMEARHVRVDGILWPPQTNEGPESCEFQVLPGAVKIWLSQPPKPAKDEPELRNPTPS